MSFSFGTPTSAPATSALSSGFSFGGAKPATPGFGLGSTPAASGGLFGTPASAAPSFGSTTTPAFGAATTPAFGATTTPAFGATSTPAFGATATPAFGATPTPAFGATSTPAFGTAAPSFGATPAFGASTASSFGATPTFGATTTPAFGTTTTQSFGAGLGTGGLNFGAASNAPTGLTFGTPASKPGLTSAFPQNSTLFGEDPGFPNIPLTQTFQMLPTTKMYHIVEPNPQYSPSHLEMGYGYMEPTRDKYNMIMPSGAGTSKLGTTTFGTQPATSVAPSLGLGGSSTSAGIGITNTTQSGDGKSEPPKQMKLPNEITSSVEAFKEFVKKQKSLSSDVMRVSIKPLTNVSREVDSLQQLAASLSVSVSRARAHSRRLRAAGAGALAAADTAQRQASGQLYSDIEGAALPCFVKDLIEDLEQQLITFRRQMDEADKQMQAAPKLLSEQELTLGIRRMHESLVALAGRLQGVHAQVEVHKELYMNLRRYVLKDTADVFGSQSNSTSLEQILRDAESCRQQAGLSDSRGAGLADPRAKLGNIQQLAGPTPFSYIGSSVSALNPADITGSAWQPQPSLGASLPAPLHPGGSLHPADTFQLQRPPGKRSKQ